jgi:nicotinamide-nucleotide amidase
VGRRNFVEVVTVGDELLLGETLDGNAAFIARECARAGFEVRRKTTLPDDPQPLREGLAEARARGGIVVVTGGLGPTPDDLTRWALAAVFGRGLVLDPGLLAELERKFRRFGYAVMPAANRVQAELPEGAAALPNPRGTAVGILIEDERVTMFALPGVPSEMEGMFVEEVLPRMKERAGRELAPLYQRVVRTAGIGESALAERIADLASAPHGLRVAYLPNRGSVDIRLTATGIPEEEARRALAELERWIAERLAPWVYGRDKETLAQAVGQALAASGRTLAVAESCTGGLISDMITDVPGSSAYFLGAVIAYSNELKQGLLGVSEATLASHGAVSAETCAEMLAGARRRLGAGCAVAVTGIAGPGGGTPTKPVGLVHLGVDVEGEVRLERREWPGTRRDVKLRAAKASLLLLLRTLEAVPSPATRGASGGTEVQGRAREGAGR